MPKPSRALLPLVLLAAVLPATRLVAQPKITLRTVPAPNQVIRLSMTQDLAFDVVMEGMAMGPIKVEGHMTFGGLERVGAPDAQGMVVAEVTLDDVTIDMKTNGSPTPTPMNAEQIKGKTITVIYDAQGKVVDVKTPEGLGDSGGNMKEMISALSGAIPNATLAIGESTTTTVSVPLPIPIPGNAGPTTLESKTTSKLVSITREGADHIASLDQTTAAGTSRTMEVPGPNGPMSASVELKMTGTGTLQLNVDKGFVKSGSNDMKLDMTMLMQGTTMKMNGTAHVVMTGTAQD